MKTSVSGFTRCPTCLRHVKLKQDTMSCPFCEEELHDAEIIGTGVLQHLSKSRTSLLALGLAGGLAFAVACADEDSNNDNIDEYNEIHADYGGFDSEYAPDSGEGPNNVDFNAGMSDAGDADAGMDMGSDDAGTSDAGTDDAGQDMDAEDAGTVDTDAGQDPDMN